MANNTGEPKRNALSKTLDDVGLDPDHWTGVLKSEFNIQSVNSLQYLDERCLGRLNTHCRETWEESALKSLIGLSSAMNSSVYHENERKARKEEMQKAEVLLTELRGLERDGKGYTDVLVSQILDEVRNILSIPSDLWIGSSSVTPFGTLIDNLRKCVDKIKDSSPPVVFDPRGIIEKASNGLLLRGILWTHNLEDYVQRRKLLLNVPGRIHVTRPGIPVDTKVLEICSKIRSENFENALGCLGYTVAASVGVESPVGIAAGGNCSTNHTEESENEHASNIDETFISRVICSLIPVASIELHAEELIICGEALTELKAIEQLVNALGDDVRVQEACARFFTDYGSHVNVGTVHVGGIYKWKTTFSSKTFSSKETIKSLVKDASSGLVSLSYSGLGVSVGGSVSADIVREKMLLHGSYNQSDLSTTQFHCQTLGGPIDASSFPQWIAGLKSDSSTWAVIDRGELREGNLVGIWTIVRNQKQMFKDKTALSKLLAKAWERMTRTSVETVKEITFLIGDAYSNIEEIVRSACESDSNKKYKDTLRRLLDQKKELETEVGSTGPWEFFVKESKCFSEFLLKLTKVQPEDEDLACMKFYVKQLMEHVETADFPEKLNICSWIDPTEPRKNAASILSAKEYTNGEEFLSALSEHFLPWVQDEERKHLSGGGEKIHTRANTALSLGTLKLLRALESSNKLEYVFITSMMQTLSFNIEMSTFEADVTSTKLETFSKKCSENLEKFRLYEKNDKVKCQAFVIQLASDCIDETYKDVNRGKLLCKLINPIEEVLVDEVKAHYFAFKNQEPLNVVALSDTMETLMDGNRIRASMVDLARILSGSQFTQEEKMAPKKRHVFCEEDPVLRLGLCSYFPSKITVSDVIGLTSTDGKTKFPWSVLKHIISSDLSWRDKLIPEMQLNTQKNYSVGSQLHEGFFDDVDSFLEIGSDKEAPSEDIIHPNDVLYGTWCCCNDELKQAIFQKLFLCKQAVPLMFRMPQSEKPLISLLPLRSLFMECGMAKQHASIVCAATHATQIVAFVRVQRPSISKSKLINEVMSEQSHATFCYRDLLPGETSQMVTKGIIEAAWYLPSGKDTDIFQEIVAFLNMRGDAIDNRQELSILGKMASVVIAVLDVFSLTNDGTVDVLNQLQQSPALPLLLLTLNPESKDPNAIAQCMKNGLSKLGKIAFVANFHARSLAMKTAATVKEEVRRTITWLVRKTECRSVCQSSYSFENQKLVLIDESMEVCMAGRAAAMRVYSKLCDSQVSEGSLNSVDEMPVVKSKEQSLPLQGQFWKEWSRHNKAQKRTMGQSPSLENISKLKVEMRLIRKQQVNQPLSTSVKELIQHLTKFDDEKRLSLTMWLKIFLRENERKIMPGLIAELDSAWKNVRNSKDQPEERMQMQNMEKAANAAEVNLNEASFGFEHFMRELGQIYESGIANKDNDELSNLDCVFELPKIAARLLYKGQPMEILDGDAGDIPLTWIKEVLNQLKQFIGNKKLFIVSVLGIQSSGKSTLLNTMFGLQFSVSAGRCTRGAFAQLIPIIDERFACDYFLIIDTEGIRAPELRQMHLDHDNKLATFAIGIADVTLINIKGENTAEVKDVLQIAVHAFLRMKLANKRLDLRRKCIFIHQNVGAVTAPAQMLNALRELQQTLDDMTQYAAEQEGAHILRFNQVIHFQGEEDVLYFPDLWLGNLPMAPCNPGYSEKAQEVRGRLLEFAAGKKSFIAVEQLYGRISDIWNAILSDNFVFSFRNSLEIKAYNTMDAKYHELTSKYEEAIMTWFYTKACVRIENCEIVDELNSCLHELRKDLEEEKTAKKNKTYVELERFFINSEEQEIIIQWKDNRLKKFLDMAMKLAGDIEIAVKTKVQEQRLAILSKTHDVQKEIYKKTRELAEQLRGQQTPNSYLDEKFSEMWIECTEELVRRKVSEGESVRQKILREFMDTRLEKYHQLYATSMNPTTDGYLTKMRLPEHQFKLKGSWGAIDIDN